MDLFRQLQKKQSPDGSPNKHGSVRIYGCSCCRKIPYLLKHKKVTRKLSRAKLKCFPFEF